MTASEWRWRPVRQEGIWKHGCPWARPFTAAVPWITLAMLLVMFGLIGERMAVAPGVAFELPDPVGDLSEITGFAAFAMPEARENGAEGGTLVFFDDARFSLSDPASLNSLQSKFAERASTEKRPTLLLLADRRIPAGDLMRLVGIARESGIVHVQIAEKRK
ncbi:MAG: hypothetical protein ACI4Q3_06545 [Kiritimatiellia bacterium]